MSQKIENFYNRFAAFYPLVDVFLKPQKRRLFQEVNKLSFGELLEIGVGNGSHLRLYEKHNVKCIDTSLQMLKRAGEFKKKNTKLFHMNGETLLFPDQSFDYVVLSHVLTVVDDPEKLLEEVHRVLSPHGRVFILNHFTPNNWPKYFDYFFQFASKIFHFKSVFHIDRLSTIKKFTLLEEINVSKFLNFKILIYKK